MSDEPVSEFSIEERHRDGTVVLTVHGEAQPNREVDSGDWLATPQDSGTRCVAWMMPSLMAGG